MNAHSFLQTTIMNKPRTAGDGMESLEDIAELSQKSKTNLRPAAKVLLPGRLIQVYPTNIIKKEKKKHIQAKSPKFVPYEPYAAAVKPMTPEVVSKVKKSRNNLDIITLVSQMSQMDTKLNEFKPRGKLLSSVSDKLMIDKHCPEKVEMQKKIEELLNENKTIKEQLDQQVQVNKELKTMLVASLGEDLEIQVQSLNEDKKHLANALLSSSQHLSTHQEQTEWLAGQCEVWRSKFLASSLMVEELANSKKSYIERTEHMQQAVKLLLDERCRVRDMMLYTYRNLYSLHEKWLENLAISEGSNSYSRPIGNLNFNATVPHSSNLLDLATVNLKISENISSAVDKQDIGHVSSLTCDTEGEKNAENIMAMPLEVRRVNEEPVNALVHHAYNTSGNTTRSIASCVHCNGKVQLL